MVVSTSDAIIIIGAGALALSTALHLSQQGYTNVSVFAKEQHIPSGNLTPVIYHAAQASGVQFFLGQPVDGIIYVSTLTGKKNAGIRTRNAQFHSSSTVIIEAGAGDGSSRSGIGYASDSLATPLSWYSNTSDSLIGYWPQEASSVILLPRISGKDSRISTTPSVLSLLQATSGQNAVEAAKLVQIVPPTLSRL
ncbi:uncharacterized protein N7515_002306 [Penicillium bovifimosum]|uniref:FAD dependent oxidoreductase domain-containing protein n=1 Tax=Penicillium bovifimosum TaxID=126998 RepID=A0A9W9L9J5_9EURO|nr:uncharacterized protein N7515_002306 [Penicillium bovifimosum]KAJ5143519.1 hypothetical protein N7515_002306 [Penicillium bovifimosum]